MTARVVEIHAFCSTKGGVGKSTLAVVAANLILSQRGMPVVIDLDLTGSSLADGLDLVAPNLMLDAEDRFDPAAPVTSVTWLDTDGTRRRRALRSRHRSGSAFIALPYSNDALLARTEANVHRWLWRDQAANGVRFLPASSIRADVERATRMLVEMPGPEWCGALICTLEELVIGDPLVTDIVLDLPPGTWGFGHAALEALRSLSESTREDGLQWTINPVLVTSADTNALIPSLEYVASSLGQYVPDLLVAVNRSDEGPENLRRRIRAKLGEVVSALGLDELPVFVDERRALREIFRGKQLEIAEHVDLVGVLRLGRER